MKKETLNIFYADDDRDDREFFVDAGRDVSADINVITQRDGDELIQMLQNPPPVANLLFLDLNMPVKNGFEVLKELKQSAETKDLPVIVFSTSDDAEAILATRELGANLYIQKPNSYADLKEVIRHSISIDWSLFSPTTDQFVYKIK